MIHDAGRLFLLKSPFRIVQGLARRIEVLASGLLGQRILR
jgi:hypothetical protein